MSKEKTLSVDPKKKRLQTQILVIAIVVAAFVVCHFITGGRLLAPNNLRTILTQVTYPMIVALGMMFIFTGGMIDLSIGAQAILAGNVAAVLVEDFGLGYAGLIIGAIVTMIVCELLSASCSVFLGIPSWVAGLGAALVFEAIATIYVGNRAKTAGAAVVYLKHCQALGKFPTIFIIAIAVFVVAWFIFNRTKLGFNLRAIGGGGEVAEAMGINRVKTIMLSAAVGAVIISIGVITQLSYTGRFTTSAGMGSLSGIFKSLAVILIAGSFSRIYNDAVGCVIGAFIVAGLFNVLTLMGVPSGTGQDVCLGMVVLVCGILSSLGYKGVMK